MSLVNKCGIYTIKCESNGRFYVGQSKNFNQRKNEHLSKLRRNNHENIHLQRTFNKYGEDSLSWSIDECEEEFLTELEQFILDNANKDLLFNINLKASVPPVSKKGRPYKKLNRPQWNTGLNLSEEHKAKISAGCKGMKMPESQKQASVNRMKYNHPLKDPKAVKKLSESKMRFNPQECMEIAEKYSRGTSQDKLAVEYKCNRMCIRTALKYNSNYQIGK